MAKTRVPYGSGMVDAEIVPINSMNENQATYLLADGTVLTVRTVVTQVARVPNAWNDEGDPVYVIKSGQIVTSSCPDHLRKKA